PVVVEGADVEDAHRAVLHLWRRSRLVVDRALVGGRSCRDSARPAVLVHEPPLSGGDLLREVLDVRDRRPALRGAERLNSYPQFVTDIDGQPIHFLHVRSGRQDALALLLTHGWPGSVVEYLDVVEPLRAAGFDLVIPSIPGFGFSGPTTQRGWGVQRTARAWVE